MNITVDSKKEGLIKDLSFKFKKLNKQLEDRLYAMTVDLITKINWRQRDIIIFPVKERRHLSISL
jgi:hypothetical protein